MVVEAYTYPSGLVGGVTWILLACIWQDCLPVREFPSLSECRAYVRAHMTVDQRIVRPVCRKRGK